jgi:acetyl-CoA C-acetyltransferase
MTSCIVGWSHGRFGKHDALDVEALVVEVARAALADAKIAAKDVDEIFIGTFNAGFVKQDFPASLVLQADDALRFKPATRVENACATGSAAIYQGIASIEAKKARHVLVVGVEKMTELAGADIGEVLTKASYLKEEGDQASFAEIFGRIAERYFQRFGDKSDALARIAAKNHRNGAANPYAHFQKDLGYEFCATVSDKNPLVAGPLRRTDCSPVTDGAAALVLADLDTALGSEKAIVFRAARHVNDFLPLRRRDATRLEGAAEAWRGAFADARLGLEELDLMEVHDCFTIAELMIYEAIGLAPHGKGARVIDEGWTEKSGKLPVNPSGGLKSKGHPIGATGVSMHVLAAMQLAGQAGGMQIPDATLAGVFNMGGTGVANYASILERLR